MSHEFESGFFSGGKPAWHGLGEVLEGNPKTAEEAIRLAGLDWRVEKRKMFLNDDTEVPNNFAMVRDSDNSVLGVVGNRYKALQNEEAFSFFDPIIKDELAEFETAGALLGGKRVWALAKLKGEIEIGKDDVVDKFVLLSNSHDGTSNVVAKVTPVRVVCWNTLSAALGYKAKKAGDEIKIRHTKSVTDKVEKASKLLTTINEMYDNLYKVWQTMAKTNMPPQDVVSYFETVFPDPEKSERPYKTQQIRAEMHQLMADSSIGGTLDTAMGTVWGSFNAITAYVDHVKSKRKDSSDEKHLENVWFGQRQKVRNDAFTVAMKYMEKQGVSIDV